MKASWLFLKYKYYGVSIYLSICVSVLVSAIVLTLSVCQGKIDDELAAQIADFSIGDQYIFCRQRSHGILIAPSMDKKRIPNFNDDIKTESTSPRYKVLKLFGFEDSVAMGTVQYRLSGIKFTDIHGGQRLYLCFLNMERSITYRTFWNLRVKMYNRLFRK